MEALALVEYDAVATGLRALDALVKQAEVRVLEANLVEPGKFLLLFGGAMGEVEESHQVAVGAFRDAVLEQMLIPHVHPSLVEGLKGREVREAPDCLGVIEGKAVAPTLLACDRALKEALVQLAGVRVTGGLGGRAYFVVSGVQHDVEAAIETATGVLEETAHRLECIPNPHDEMVAWVLRRPPFGLGA